jgi:uncharacterized membrane protein
MKRRYGISVKVICFFLSLTYAGCTYDNAEELHGKQDCGPESVSFSNNIAPLISTNCALSGCHVSGQQLPVLENYQQISQNAQAVKTKTGNGTMPPDGSGKSLTLEEINQIACWVDSGSQNN